MLSLWNYANIFKIEYDYYECFSIDEKVFTVSSYKNALIGDENHRTKICITC